MKMKPHLLPFLSMMVLLPLFCSACQVQNNQTIIPTLISTQLPTQETATSTLAMPMSSPTPTQVGIAKELLSLQPPEQNDYYSPEISSDGHWVAIPGYTPSSKYTGTTNVWIYDLTKPNESQWFSLFSPALDYDQLSIVKFSPDGQHLAAVSDHNIRFFDTNNWTSHVTYHYNVLNGIYTWSPDSKGIAVEIREKESLVYLLKLDGSLAPLLIEKDVFPDGIPVGEWLGVYRNALAWSSDGHKLAYLQGSEGSPSM